MKFFILILVVTSFVAGALVCTVAATKTNLVPVSASQFPACIQQLQKCQLELETLRSECMADQVSMRELESCIGFEDFSLQCLEGDR